MLYARSTMRAYVLAKGHPRKPDTAISDVLRWERIERQLHPNKNPSAQSQNSFRVRSPEGGLIIDPFCGSGTTLVASSESRETRLGIEIEERFCEITTLSLSQEILKLEAALAPSADTNS